jgi:transcription antitermination factor NusG
MRPAAWYAVQTRANKERAVKSFLADKGYEVFLPTYELPFDATAHQLALFPGYLFVRVEGGESGKVVTTPGVVRVVGYNNRWSTVDEQEIANIRAIVCSDRARRPWSGIPIGSRVRIERGPLRGVEGRICKNGTRLIVSLTLLGRAVEVELLGMADLTIAKEADDLFRCAG